jgi:hypothetical protein
MRVSTARAGWLLVGYGAAILAVALVGVIAWGGGVAFFAVAVPLLAAGFIVHRQVRGARLFGVAVAAVYGIASAYVATTTLRGLAPAPGQGAAGLDTFWTVVAVAFLAAAVLVGISRADPWPTR